MTGQCRATHAQHQAWMFPLGNLVRSAVQAAITVLNPVLGANLAGGEPRVEDVHKNFHCFVLSKRND